MTPAPRPEIKHSLRSSKQFYHQYREDLRTQNQSDSRLKEPKSERPSQYRRENFRLYLKTLSLFRWKIAVVLVLAIIVALLETAQPRLIGDVVDHILTNDRLNLIAKQQQLLEYTLILLTLVCVARFTDAFRDFRINALNTLVTSQVRRMLYGQLLRLPVARLYQLKTGGVVSRLTGDLEQLTGLVQMAFISPVVACIRVIITLIIVSVWNWKLALVVVLLLVPMAVGSFLWLGPVRKIWAHYWKLKSETEARISETFSGIRVVRAFQREESEELRNTVSTHALARFHLYCTRYTSTVYILWSILIPLANVFVLYIGGRLVFEANASIGQITGLMGYTSMLMGPVYNIVQSFGDVQKSLAAMDRIFDHLREPDECDDPPDAVDVPSRVDTINFEHVYFGYTPDKPIIHDISLSVPRGATVAFVGASGAGKSTLSDLVARFYNPTNGQLTLNGIPFEKIKLHRYRRLLGIVSQDVFLFDGTVGENIAYGRPHASREEIIEAAMQANAHDFISELPDGYDTMTGERGARLSGGQRQRLSIARAILADPQILILDEATSALDSRSERLIQEAVEKLEANRTTFVIAHRLSTIAKADIIVVLEKGHIIEQGTHEQLLSLQGHYWHMVEQQKG